MSSISDTRAMLEKIFRACRLCGAGGGYKMPIVQSIIPYACADVELREKIRDCLQIEVQENDKMPPLICELCVDKVSEFYEYQKMCQQTQKRTRLRLGLPPQTAPQGAAEDCILGVTETVFSSSSVVRSRPCPKSKKNVIILKKEEVKVDTPKAGQAKESRTYSEGSTLAEQLATLKRLEQRFKVRSESQRTSQIRINYADSPSSSVSGRSSPVPDRHTRRITNTDQTATPRALPGHHDFSTSSSSACAPRKSTSDNISLGKIKQEQNRKQEQKQEQQKQALKTASKKGKDTTLKVQKPSDSDEEMLSTTRAKRRRESDTPNADVPRKKIKLTIKLPPAPKVPTLAPNECPSCGFISVAPQGLYSHMKQHRVLFTPRDLACDPCCKWFSTIEETESHHQKHTKYKCRHCKRHFKQRAGYDEHFEVKGCRPCEGLPDVQCQTCWAFFPTATLMKQHRCPGIGGRPGGNCGICSKDFATAKTLKKHEEHCASTSKESKPPKAELPKPAKNEVCKDTKGDVSKPTKKEYAKTFKNEASKPTKNEHSKIAKNEAAKLTKNEYTKTAKNEASKPTKNEYTKTAKNAASKLTKNEYTITAKSEASKLAKSEISKKGKVSKSAKSEVRIDPKIRRRLQPAAIRVAKCDPILKTRRSNSGRYNVANVTNDYGLDTKCTYPYKRCGARVKSKPRCFNRMVFSNKDIQRKLYKEEDYVHWDSDLSSDSETEVGELGLGRRQVPTLTAFSLKTIFSKRYLGKVPRKLRKVKQDKLFDSLYNSTVDEDLTCSVNSVIDTSSKEDESSVNLLNSGVNYDSESVDKSILSCADAFDLNDVNKSNKDLNASVETQIIDKNDVDCNETDVSTNDTKHSQNKKSVNNDSGSDRTEADLGSQNGDTQDEVYNPLVNTMENNCESNNGMKDIHDETAKKTEETKNDNEDSKNDGTNHDVIGSNQSTEVNDACKENGETYSEIEHTCAKNGETIKKLDFSNGVSDKIDNFGTEIENLNAQIGESEMKEMESRQLDTCGNLLTV